MDDMARAEFGDNQWLIAAMRDRYLSDRTDVPGAWAAFFDDRPDMLQANLEPKPAGAQRVAAEPMYDEPEFPTRPPTRREMPAGPLELSAQGLTLWDLNRQFHVWKLRDNERGVATLHEIIDLLRDLYCHTISVEYTYLQDLDVRDWWQTQIQRAHAPRPREEQLCQLNQLIKAEVFETFLQTKYAAQTRFLIEGGESAIVLLSQLCEQSADASLDEVCIGMPYREVFGEGDVTYRLSAEGDYKAVSGKTVRCLVGVESSGIARAKIDKTCGQVLPVLVYNDQLWQMSRYRTGGTIHLVVNNQAGFTTVDAWSSVNCTEVAKVVQAPVLHVNCDDPDACARAAEMAFAFRQRFQRDVVINLVC